MLIFYCTDCKETINCPDNEGPDRAFARLDEHIAKYPLATFTFEGTTDFARQTADVIRSIIQHDRLPAKLRLH